MKQIQMVDLHSQYEKIKAEIDCGIRDVIASSAFIKGSVVSDFEAQLAQYLGVKHVITVGNGTDALQIALMALDLKPGDEVIIPAFTFISTAEVVALLGLTPVFVDVDYDTMTISVEAIEKVITSKTKAIVPVHLFGQNADTELILNMAEHYGLYVVEDACQSIGAEYTFKDGRKKKSGCMGDIGCTSFFPSKNLGCFGDGGALFTDDDLLAEKIRMIANHGMRERYHHDIVGVNSRLDSIQAAVLSVKLTHLDEYNAARRGVAEFYDREFASVNGLTLPVVARYTTHVFHQYTVKVGVDRLAARDWMSGQGVPSMVYYPVPLHLQTAFETLGYKRGDFPIAERLSDSVLSLPIHTELDGEQLNHIANVVIKCLANNYNK